MTFYQQTFGWKVDSWGGPQSYWLVSTGSKGQAGIEGSLLGRSSVHKTSVNMIEVPSVDEFIKKISEQGGAIVRPKQTISGIGYAAYCQDTEGNIFGIFQSDSAVR